MAILLFFLCVGSFKAVKAMDFFEWHCVSLLEKEHHIIQLTGEFPVHCLSDQ